MFAYSLFSGSSAHAQNISASARSYMLMEAQTGRVLLEGNSDEKLPMASTTKIMTCLLACEKGNMKDVVTAGKNCVGIEGTSIYLKEGETITLEELCYGLMLASGNDAAVAIAEHLAGSSERFCEMMTERAKQLGANDTNFVTPNGLPAQGHYTTARDLAKIASAAMQNELFRGFVSKKSITLEADEDSPARYLKSKNKILLNYEGGNGVKTGYTKQAGKCLVAGAKRGEMQLIAVVLNDYAMWDDCERLLDYGFENYSLKKADEKKTLKGAVEISDGIIEKTDGYIEEDIYLPLKEDDSKIEIKYEIYKGITAPLRKGTQVGEAKYSLDGIIMKTVPIYLKEDVRKDTLSYRLSRLIREMIGLKERKNERCA